MSTTVAIEVKESDLVEGYRLASKWPRKRWISFASQTVIFLMAGALLVSSSTAMWRRYGWIIFISLALGWSVQWVLHVLMNSTLLRGRFRTKQGPASFSWGEEGVTASYKARRTHLPWSQVTRWSQGSHVVVICSASRYVVVPTRDNPAAADLVDLLAAKVTSRG